MEGFEDFQDLITAMAMIAEIGKSAFDGFMAKGFTEKQAIELTKGVIHEIMSPIFNKAMESPGA